MSEPRPQHEGIAIIGMAGRFPKAGNIEAFWENMRQGRECISAFADEELETAGIEFPKRNQKAIKARGLLEDADKFDAAFFGVNPREAQIMDPQHRLFLECAWEALDDAGYDSDREEGLIGVFAGSTINTYFITNLLANADLLETVSAYQLLLGNDKDFFTTRVSYKLNLRGPSMAIQTACSTSLVAVCVACQNLLTYQCDMALAGGVAVTFPQKHNHLYQEGGIASPDGHCRAFDAKAQGTVPGEGVGIVVLKRLSEALADGDQIYAVIKGFGLNNDGGAKAGYTAPSEIGQSEAIAMAMAMAGFEPDTIGYIEAHGTGTPLGDPIEIAGLTRAFRGGTDAKNFCAIGSVKTSIGHLDVAAGIAGLINATLALHHKMLPPSLYFETPNPEIDFANSPFYVNTRPTPWKAGATPRRAGVSSFGIGSTNAHVALEEAPPAEPAGSSRPAQLIVLSARTSAALNATAKNLIAHLKRNPGTNLADMAYTLQIGRRLFPHRHALVCGTVSEAIAALESAAAPGVSSKAQEQRNSPVAFLFPGQGAQRVNMGRELYESEAVFREQVDACAEMLKPRLGSDLREILYPPADKLEASQVQLNETAITQPALFVIEYALARLWMSWGIEPAAMAGHSIGEYAAACLAGVFSLEDALRLVAERGRLMQLLPDGAMLAVRLPEMEIQPLLNAQLSLAAVNGPNQCVVSGAPEAIEQLQRELTERGVMFHRLETSRAFHSPMVEPALEPFTKVAGQVALRPPLIPFVSNVSGTWITAEQATDPAYWAQHMRQTVRFADGAGELLKKAGVLLEVGPGQILSALSRQNPAKGHQPVIVSSLPNAQAAMSEIAAMLTALGHLLSAGVPVNWAEFYAQERRRRVPLPGYPFERKRFWVESTPSALVPRSLGTGENIRPTAAPDVNRRTPHEETPAPANIGGYSRIETMDGSNTPRPQPQTIKSELQVLFGKLLGSDLTAANGETTFIEMGFDSLMLTHASQTIEKQFGARIPFGQLLARFSTFDSLAAAVEKSRMGAGAVGPAHQREHRPATNHPANEPSSSLLIK